jgi:hypothetical protein
MISEWDFHKVFTRETRIFISMAVVESAVPWRSRLQKAKNKLIAPTT